MGVKPFNVTSLSKVHLVNPKEIGYQDSIDIILDELHRTRRSFVKIGWYLKHIEDDQMYEKEGYSDIFEFALDKFNISQPTANRFMNICKEFSIDHDSPELDERYIDFNVSQLFEMLPMKEEEREQISPDMTVKQIREVKEAVKKKRKTEVSVDSDEIPGQTCFEKDFPEYMPDNQETERTEILQIGCISKEPEVVTENSYREIDDSVKNQQEKPNEEIYLINKSGYMDSYDQKSNQEVCDLDMPDPLPDPEPVQPELPVLKNNDSRKKWLEDYKDWGLWYRDDRIDVNYYKYDFVDGSRLVVAEYPKREAYWTGDVRDEQYYHLLQKNKEKYGGKKYDEKYRHSTDSETYLVEFLKNLQKKA